MKPNSGKNYYDVLGVSKTASPEEIKDSYRKLSKTHHPDVGGDPEKMKDINEAYSILSNPEQKQEYDNPINEQTYNPFGGGNPFNFHSTGNPFDGGNFGNINLNDFLNNLRGFSSSNRQFIIHQRIIIDLIKALEGGEITIHVNQIGKDIKFDLPPNIQPHTEFTVRINPDDKTVIILSLKVIVELPYGLHPEKIKVLKELLKEDVGVEHPNSGSAEIPPR